MTKKKVAKLVITMVFVFFTAITLFVNPIETLFWFAFVLAMIVILTVAIPPWY